jgi:hypothetical protein
VHSFKRKERDEEIKKEREKERERERKKEREREKNHECILLPFMIALNFKETPFRNCSIFLFSQ